VKEAWKRAWAHSAPRTPATVEGPVWVWQVAQSCPATLTSAWSIWSRVPAGTPEAGWAAALDTRAALISPAGRLLPVPGTAPLPFWSPWHAWQAPGLVTLAWKAAERLQAPSLTLASAAWQRAQSAPVTAAAPWFIHWPALLGVPPIVSG